MGDNILGSASISNSPEVPSNLTTQCKQRLTPDVDNRVRFIDDPTIITGADRIADVLNEWHVYHDVVAIVVGFQYTLNKDK
ncbi:hypothetical protein BJ742DRAFT_775068 [Cladochytrium replicatum]|nr:hypothetical protein BJ742DRAFT_775068 [Cladochytrium replicatum]